MESDNNEQIAKSNPRQIADDDSTSESTDTLDGERPEMPEEVEQMGGPMSGKFPGEISTGTVAGSTNEWLIPMAATGIISGTIILAAVAVCLTIFFTKKKN